MGTYSSHLPSQPFLLLSSPAPALSPPGLAVHSSPWALEINLPSSFCIPSASPVPSTVLRPVFHSLCAQGCPLVLSPLHPLHQRTKHKPRILQQAARVRDQPGVSGDGGQNPAGPFLPHTGPGYLGKGTQQGPNLPALCTTSSHLFPFSCPCIIPARALIFSNDTIWWFGGFWQENFCDPQSTGACLLLLGEEDCGCSADPRQAVVITRAATRQGINLVLQWDFAEIPLEIFRPRPVYFPSSW